MGGDTAPATRSDWGRTQVVKLLENINRQQRLKTSATTLLSGLSFRRAGFFIFHQKVSLIYTNKRKTIYAKTSKLPSHSLGTEQLG